MKKGVLGKKRGKNSEIAGKLCFGVVLRTNKKHKYRKKANKKKG